MPDVQPADEPCGGRVHELRHDLAREARALIAGDRQDAYSPPADNHSRIAQAWSAILGVPVEARSVALCFAAAKLVREAHCHQRDNLVDAIAYVYIADELSTVDPLRQPGV